MNRLWLKLVVKINMALALILINYFSSTGGGIGFQKISNKDL